MKLIFSWCESAGVLVPHCSSNVLNKENISPLACLLIDSGGQKILDTVPWLNEGVERTKAAKVGGGVFADWSRDAWGAEIKKEKVKIYSLYDETCFELIDFNLFEKALLEWRAFVQMTPAVEVIRDVEV